MRGGGCLGGGCSSKIIMVILAIVVIVFIINGLKDGFGGETVLTTGMYPSQNPTASSVATTDTDAVPVDTNVSGEARSRFTSIRGNGADTVTVMVYMCGTDLESKSGAASADLQEILYGEISEKVNIILETGGTADWQNSVISSKTNQRYKLTNKGLQRLEDNLGKRSMVDPNTLSEFIQYSKANYPADRYMLVLWDHGGGSLTGFGYDELFKNDSMTIDEIGTALKDGGCSFDIVGFDACLMGTLETAIVLEPYADYMIASEEVEPGIGWDYTGWITALSQNTSIPTTNLGKKLIDDYILDVRTRIPKSQATLALVDLAELSGTVPGSFRAFAASTGDLIDQDQYQTVSDARVEAKEFARSSQLNQIDLIHFAENLGTPEARTFADALRGCIKYNRTTNNITNANGLSIYFPYGSLTRLNAMLRTYDRIGLEDEYSECIRSFASLSAGGQVVSSGGGTGGLLDILLGGQPGEGPTTPSVTDLLSQFLASGDFSSITGLTDDSVGWLDVDRMKASVAYYEVNRFDAAALQITVKGNERVLALPDDQWDLVQYMEMNVFLDDGQGFIDLGLDNVYAYNDDGDLIMEYDGTWLAMNGQIVSYYMVSDDHDGDDYTITGRVPAMLNDQRVDIILVFDNENPLGVVLGAQVIYDAATETETVTKGLQTIVVGDKIDYLCDYYTYDGQYSDTYFLGEPYTATGAWEIENLPIGADSYQMTYRITDIYNNQYWTASISD